MTKPAAVGGVSIPRKSNVLTASWYSDDTIDRYEKGKLPTSKHLSVMATKNLLRTGASLGSLANLFLWVKKIVTGSGGSSNFFFSSNKFLIPSTLFFGALPFLESLLRSNSDINKNVADSRHQAKEAGSIHNTEAVPNTSTPEIILASRTILSNLLQDDRLHNYLLTYDTEDPLCVIEQELFEIKLTEETGKRYLYTINNRNHSHSQSINVNGKNKLIALRIALSDLMLAYKDNICSVEVQVLTKDPDDKDSAFSPYSSDLRINIIPLVKERIAA